MKIAKSQNWQTADVKLPAELHFTVRHLCVMQESLFTYPRVLYHEDISFLCMEKATGRVKQGYTPKSGHCILNYSLMSCKKKKSKRGIAIAA